MTAHAYNTVTSRVAQAIFVVLSLLGTLVLLIGLYSLYTVFVFGAVLMPLEILFFFIGPFMILSGWGIRWIMTGRRW